MSARTSAARYARALLDVAAKESDPEQAGREIDEFIELLARHASLGRVLLNPAVPASRKRGAVVELAKQAGMAPVVSKLLALLAERGRLGLLNDLSAAYRGLLLDRQNVVRAEVITAVPLSPERAASIEKRLAAVTGKRVSMETRVDGSIIGGVVARVGSTVYDGSIATQLQKIKERMTSNHGH